MEAVVGALSVLGTVQSIYAVIQTLRTCANDVIRRKEYCRKLMDLLQSIEKVLHTEDGVLKYAAEEGIEFRKEVLDSLEKLLLQLEDAKKVLKRLGNPFTMLMPAKEKLKDLQTEINETLGILTLSYVFLPNPKFKLDHSNQPQHPPQSSWSNAYDPQPRPSLSLHRDEEGSSYPADASQEF